MKKYALLVLTLIGLTISSCQQFLATESKDIISPVNYYSRESELNEALVGIYDILGFARMYQDGWWDRLGGSTDESWNFVAQRFETYNYNATDNTLRDAWQNLYQGIERANVLLENVDNVNMDVTRRNGIKGQALFLRGYYYFMLVSHWGDVPLRTTSAKTAADGQIPRTPAKDVYAQVLKDMTEAQSLLPAITTYGHNGRVSKTAAQGILARVCLTMAGYPLQDVAKYTNAKAWADSVIKSGLHTLNPNYAQVFINHSQDKYDIKECLWEAEFWGNAIGNSYSEGSRVSYNTGPFCTNVNFGYGTAQLRPIGNLYALYGDGNDLRRDWNISPYYYKNPANPGFSTTGTADPVVRLYWNENQAWERFTGKWYREYEAISPKAQITSPCNFPILRYSDVLLMYAEAENYLNGPANAVDKINQVRRRAWGTGSRVSMITVTNPGTGYTSAPAVTISGGGGSNAHATAILSGSAVTGIRVVSGGAFFASVPTVTIAGGGGTGATATAAIAAINATDADLKPAQTASKATLQATIQEERSRELCYEALRKPDLTRWGIFVTTMNSLAATIRSTAPASAVSTGNAGSSPTFNYRNVAISGENVTSRHLLFPIPSYDLSLNPLLTQNPGW